LTRQVADDLQWGVPVVVEEPAIGTQRAELQRETAPMIGTAAVGNLGAIVGGQRPVPRELVLAGIGWRSPPGSSAPASPSRGR
jgi:hypothetical protein